MITISALIVSALNSDIVNSNQGIFSSQIKDDGLAKYRSVDYSRTSKPLKEYSRVTELMNGEHFDDILRDTPDDMRPGSIILFYNSSELSECNNDYINTDNFENDIINNLPSRAFLFASLYDMNEVPKRLWYKFTPERDLVLRFNITECPTLLWVSKECNGYTEWCVNKTDDNVSYLGCNNYVEKCVDTEIFDAKNKDGLDWMDWVNNKIEIPKIGGPNPDKQFNSIVEQENWIKGRDGVTTRTQIRNAYASPALPGFTELGYKVVKIPDNIMKEFILFYNKHRKQKRNENWNSYGATQVNGHEISPYLISLDLDPQFRDNIANNYIKPMLEEWVGFELKLTSHYGLREYHSGSMLRNHIDRMDLLVISVTLSLFHLKGNETDIDIDVNNYINEIDTWPQELKWPIESVDFNGNNIRYNHKPGTAVLYESAKLIHGRPYKLPSDYNGNDLVHIGSFCHFIPNDGSWNKNGHNRNAMNSMNRFTQNIKSQKIGFKPPAHYKPEL